MEITIKDIQHNLQTLPKELFQNVNDYIEFLKEKYSKDAVAEEIPEWQKEEVARRIKYGQENPNSFVAESEMDIYLKQLENES